MVACSERFWQPIRQYIAREDQHLGNLTGRIAAIRNQLNDGFRAARYTGGNMIHNSDKVGRPMMKDVELKYIAFVPNKPQAWFVTTMSNMKQLLAEVMLGYHITLNLGWQRQFGFTTTTKGSLEV